MNDYIVVESVEQLKELSGGEGQEFSICFGIARSTKHIRWDDGKGKFEILAYIDDSEYELSPEEMEKSNIGEAIQYKKLILFK